MRYVSRKNLLKGDSSKPFSHQGEDEEDWAYDEEPAEEKVTSCGLDFFGKVFFHQAIIETDVVEEEEKDEVTRVSIFKSYVKYTWSL